MLVPLREIAGIHRLQKYFGTPDKISARLFEQGKKNTVFWRKVPENSID
jgi:hypothetical protein